MAVCKHCGITLRPCNRSGYCKPCGGRSRCNICFISTEYKRGGYCYACHDVSKNIVAAHERDVMTPHPQLQLRVERYAARASEGMPLFEGA